MAAVKTFSRSQMWDVQPALHSCISYPFQSKVPLSRVEKGDLVFATFCDKWMWISSDCFFPSEIPFLKNVGR